jgi:hypothetical protein
MYMENVLEEDYRIKAMIDRKHTRSPPPKWPSQAR